ncbi:MAG TPA: hypothetical protein PLQ55_01780 [Bacilli bacterium]|nr:hypothetical protein [Bacilli bacterium]
MMNCNSCGGSLTSSEQTCKYCGAPNPSYVGSYSAKRRICRSTTAPSYTPPRTESRSTPAAKKSVNWFMFVLLLIFFWPAAIVYLIIRIK